MKDQGRILLRGARPVWIQSVNRFLRGVEMKKYVCGVCGYVYDPALGDPDGGIPPGTAFEDLPDDWVCPVCGAEKNEFSPEE